MKRPYITPHIKSVTCDLTPLLVGSGEDERKLHYKKDIFADPYEEVL